MSALGVSLADALHFTALRRKICCPNPGFVHQLAHFELAAADNMTRAVEFRRNSLFPRARSPPLTCDTLDSNGCVRCAKRERARAWGASA